MLQRGEGTVLCVRHALFDIWQLAGCTAAQLRMLAPSFDAAPLSACLQTAWEMKPSSPARRGAAASSSPVGTQAPAGACRARGQVRNNATSMRSVITCRCWASKAALCVRGGRPALSAAPHLKQDVQGGGSIALDAGTGMRGAHVVLAQVRLKSRRKRDGLSWKWGSLRQPGATAAVAAAARLLLDRGLNGPQLHPASRLQQKVELPATPLQSVACQQAAGLPPP